MQMQTTTPQATTMPLAMLYDGECPICRFGVDHAGGIEAINAREDSALRREAYDAGYDPQTGFVIKHEGELYHGAAALHKLAQLDTGATKLTYRLGMRLFRAAWLARAVYPFFVKARAVLLWWNGVAPIESGKSTIQKQLGADFTKLHPDVQRRFAHEPAINEHIFYRGVMQRVERSNAGKLFAYLTRIIGNPLTPYAGANVKMDVLLYRRAGKAGVYWRRTYYYAGRAPYTVTSAKCTDAQGRMQECVGGGFGMKLDVRVVDGALCFRSTRYFWQCGPLYVPLPHWLTPGETFVEHKDMGNGTFRFTIRMDHALLGRTFYQQGIFMEEAHA